MHLLRPRNGSILALVLALVMVLTVEVTVAGASGPARPDVAAYAAIERVSYGEAVRRLELQDLAAPLEALLRSAHPASFGGLWIEHRPVFRIVAAFTSDESATVRRLVQGTKLDGLVAHQLVRFPLTELEATISSFEWLSFRGVADLLIDVRINQVEIRTLAVEHVADALASQSLGLPASAVVVKVDRLNKPAADIYGGLDISCTTGFGVLNNGTADRGITTAGHCANSLSYNGTSMTFQLESMGSNHDEQWHTITGYTVKNWVKDPNEMDGTRDITSRTARSSQVVGYQVCKYARVTGYGCGYITSKDSTGCQNGGTQHIYLQSQTGVDLVDPGDSGGPTFRSNSAYGQISCMADSGSGYKDAIYIAVDYVESGLGVTVLTAP